MWNMLNNGVCPPQQPTLGFKSVSSGQTNQAAIDTAGRLYTWGSSNWGYTGQTPVAIPATSNFNPHPVIFSQQVRRPFQVGTKSNWKRVDITADIYMAIDEDGLLYAWGDGASGVGGWADTAKYTYSGGVYIPGGYQALEPTLVNSIQWKDFALGWYHALGQKSDNSLWIWGENVYGYTYGNNAYAAGYISLVPIELTWVPGPVKLFAADYAVSAVVTDNDQVWIWGQFNLQIYAVPTQIPFSLPVGTSIIKLACSNDGVVILLSNGRVYCLGDTIVFNPSPAGGSLTFVAEPDNHTFVDIDCYGNKAIGIDTSGNIWAWGNMIYLVYVPHDTIPDECDYQHYLQYPTLAMADTLGQFQWELFSLGGWTYVGVNNSGELFTNGENAYSELGIGLTEVEHDHACYPIKTLPLLLDDGTANGIQVSDPGTAAVQITIASPKQISEHNPCGHWHKGLADIAGANGIPNCCWNFAVDVNGADVVLYGLGRNYPWPVIALRYNISTRIWYGPYWQLDGFYTAEWLAGASIHGTFDGIMMYGQEAVGTLFSFSLSDDKIVVKTTYHPTGIIYERYWPSAPPQICEGKIVVQDTTGRVIFLLEQGSTLEVWVSGDYGENYILGETWTHTGAYKYARIVRDGANFYVGIFYADGLAPGEIKVYHSLDGLTWTAKATVEVSIDALRFNVIAHANNVYLLCHNQLFYSTDSAASFTSRSLTQPTNFGTADGSALDLLVFYQDKLEKTNDYTVTSPVWDELPVISEVNYLLTDSTTVRGSGQYVVYTRDNMFKGERIILPVSLTMGESWDIVPTPIIYFATPEESFYGKDDPRWKFSLQKDKVKLDPQYR